MTSEIRTNTIKNRVGLGTVSYTNTGIVVSGIVTATGGLDISGDIDVDGHTNLDNVSVAGVSTFTGITNFDNGAINIINGGGAYNTHLNYNDTGINYVTSTNGGATYFRGSNNSVTAMAVQGSGPVDIDGDLRHLGDTDTMLQFGTDFIRLKTAGNTRFSINSTGKVLLDNSDGTFTIGGDNVYDNAKINLMVGSLSQTSATTEATALVIHDQNSRRNGTEGAGSWKSKITFRSTQINGNSQSEGASIVHDITYNNYSSNKMRSDLVFKTRGDAQTASSDAATEKLRIKHNGNVGVGENSPQKILHVTGNASYGAAHFGVTGTNAGNAYIGNTPVVTISTDGNGNAGTNDEKALFQIGRGGGGAGANAVTTEHLRVNLGGTLQIGGAVHNNSDIDVQNTKLTVKQTANNREDGIYIERSGERRGWYQYVGGAYGYNDAFCLSTNQNGTKTDVLSIDRGNVLAKIGGSVIIDSSNNGYGGLRIYDDSSGDYNVRYIAGRNQSATAHVFMDSGRSQNQSPWVDATPQEVVRLTHTNGISFQGDTNTFIGKYTQDSQPDHLRIVTGGKDRLHISKRGSIVAPKFGTKVIQWSSCTNKWASSRSITQYMMDFYTGASGATYHFMRMISQTDWGFEDVEVKQTRYQYSPDSGDHATFRYYAYYGSHVQETINYNQRNGGSGTNHSNWIGTQNFGPGGAHRIHEAANGGYYRDSYGTDFYVSLGNYIGVRLEVKIYNNSGLYDTGIYATASDFYPAAFGANATQSAADSWNGPRGIWINTKSNGTGTGTAPVISTSNADTGWSSGVNYLDVSA